MMIDKNHNIYAQYLTAPVYDVKYGYNWVHSFIDVNKLTNSEKCVSFVFAEPAPLYFSKVMRSVLHRFEHEGYTVSAIFDKDLLIKFAISWQ